MEISVGTAGIPHSCKERNSIEGIKRVAELGLQAMEVEFVYGVNMSMEMAEEAGAVAKELGIGLSVHAPYYINLCSEGKRLEDSKRMVSSSLDRAEALGATVVTFHSGFYGDLTEPDAFERVKRACEELKREKVLLGLEITGKHSAFGSLEEIVRICKELKGCVPVIDFAHLFARQAGKIDYVTVFEAVKPLRLSRMHCHFSNVEFTDKGEKRHLVLGDQPAFEPLAEEILKRKQSVTIISESPVLERDALKMKRVFEKLGYGFGKV